MYKILFSKQAVKDASKIKKSSLEGKCSELLEVLSIDPFITIPPYEKLVGDLKGFYSRRTNIQHRLIYEVDEKFKVVKVLRMWSHYE
ncbi:MAG: Txe/YoeB family addiction module toxin [Candidatus Midichloriaceae bacterium]|jgi:Txe/YoeB family toxin of toxin-antitoxin system|nr:Txe/YoeB family addiction module toxin [Candidatus Midichloriaceae bacterium]